MEFWLVTQLLLALLILFSQKRPKAKARGHDVVAWQFDQPQGTNHKLEVAQGYV